jgi:hypothetical protein
MEELRLVGVDEDGNRLVLEWGGENAFTLVIDDRLRSAVVEVDDVVVDADQPDSDESTVAAEPDSAPTTPEPAEQPAEQTTEQAAEQPPGRISPREIQAQVRAGMAAEDLAEQAGVPLDHVLRFAGPVLREREHVAAQAAQARLGSASGPAPLLADAVEHALARRGVDLETVTWDAGRLEGGVWTVWAEWSEPSSAARFTSTVGRATWQLDATRRQATPFDDEAHRLAGRDLDIESEDDQGTDDGDAVVSPFVPRLAPVPEEPAEVAEPRKRDTLVLETTPDAEQEHEAAPSPASGKKPKRASVPAWDDIMFGLRPEE